MKPVGELSLGELAALVCSHLRSHGLDAVLSGGATVSIYTANRYQSHDLDFIINLPATRPRIRRALTELGFVEDHRHFKHPDTLLFVEFPPGPLAVGGEPVREVVQLQFSTGLLRLISPTDCVKDRLAALYHWRDGQGLEQALLVARSQSIDLEEVARWSAHEGKAADFAEIAGRLRAAQEEPKP